MVEKLTEIAVRVKGQGDTWCLSNSYNTYPSLTETLEAYFQKNNQKNCDFRLSPLKGILYVIEEGEDEKEEPKKYNIYGE